MRSLEPSDHLQVFHEVIKGALHHADLLLQEIDKGINDAEDLDATIFGIALETSHVLACLSPIASWITDEHEDLEQDEWLQISSILQSPVFKECLRRYSRSREGVFQIPLAAAPSAHEAIFKYVLRTVDNVLVAASVRAMPFLRAFACSANADFDYREEDPEFNRFFEQVKIGLTAHPYGAGGVVKILHTNFFSGKRSWRFTSEEYQYVRAWLEKENLALGTQPINTGRTQQLLADSSPSESAHLSIQSSDQNHSSQTGKPTRPKKSTQKGEARAKIIAALTLHHNYGGDGELNIEPIGNNELARKAEVDPSTTSAFFKREFKPDGRTDYRRVCNDPTKLRQALQHLNGETPAYKR